MSQRFAVTPAQHEAFASAAEIPLLRQALERRPGNEELRDRLAVRLNDVDAFDETIALFDPARDSALAAASGIALRKALFARRGPADLARARDLAITAAAISQAPAERAQAMSDHAKALLHLGDQAAALALLREALALDRGNVGAFKRLVLELLRAGRASETLDLTDALWREGVRHSRLLAARTMALAVLERVDEARQLTDIPAFFASGDIPPPSGWDSAEAFNAQLEREIMVNPTMRFERFGTASAKTWRVDSPANAASPAVRALLTAIAGEVERYRARNRDPDHPWLAARPARALIDCWCVITEGQGNEVWHMHPFGWMTGGYYIAVPDAVENGADEAGCLALGLPDGIIGAKAAAAFGEHRVRPRPGLLTMFPSHAYHRTFPHRTGQRRICLAFDIVPAD